MSVAWHKWSMSGIDLLYGIYIDYNARALQSFSFMRPGNRLDQRGKVGVLTSTIASRKQSIEKAIHGNLQLTKVKPSLECKLKTMGKRLTCKCCHYLESVALKSLQVCNQTLAHRDMLKWLNALNGYPLVSLKDQYSHLMYPIIMHKKTNLWKFGLNWSSK